jgi:cellobiose-specific phosphotransferase system component IIA
VPRVYERKDAPPPHAAACTMGVTEEEGRTGVDLERAAMELIAGAGSGKSRGWKALEVGIDGDLGTARRLLDEGCKDLRRAQGVWKDLLEAFAADENAVPPNLLITHALDIMMSAETELEMARHVLRLVERRDGR